jgi:hypothetical protein
MLKYNILDADISVSKKHIGCIFNVHNIKGYIFLRNSVVDLEFSDHIL